MEGRVGARLVALAAVCLPLVGSPIEAAGAEITWEQCLSEAASANAELKAGRFGLEASTMQRRAAWAGFLPQVSATVGHETARAASSSAISSQALVSLSASENLFNGFRDRARMEQAGANESVAREALRATEARIGAELKSGFAGLLFAQQSVKLSEDIVRRRQENLRLVELRFDDGRENRGSVQLSKAYLTQARLELTQSRNNLLSARNQLLRAIGRDGEADSPLEAKGSLPLVEPPSDPDLLALAPETPEVRQAGAQQASSEASLVLARGALFPSLDVSGSIGRTGSDWFPEGQRWSLGVSLSVPLFSGGRDFYALKSAAASREAAVANVSNAGRQAQVRVRQAHSAYAEAVERVKVDLAFLQAAKTRSEIARNKYNNGLMSFEDWNLIENELINRERAVLQSQRDRAVAEAAWEQAIGGGPLVGKGAGA